MELGDERGRDDEPDTHQRRVDDPTDLLGLPLHRPGQVHLVEGEADRPDREREHGEHHVRAHHPELGLGLDQRSPAEGDHDADGDGESVRRDQALLQVQGADG